MVGYADPDSEPNVILGGLGFGGKSDEGNFPIESIQILLLILPKSQPVSVQLMQNASY